MTTSAFKPPSMNWDSDDLPADFEAFQQYCNLIFDGPFSGKSPKEKAAYILIWIGRIGLETFNTFTWVEETDKKKPNKIFEMFTTYLAPKVNKWMSRLKLQETKQSKDESIDDFMKRCRLQTSKCKFSDQDEINNRLVEQLIFGVYHNKVRERILEKGDNLDLDTALDLGRTYEATMAHLETLSTTTNIEVDALYSNHKKCFNCGGDHDRSKQSCPAYGKECHYCKIRNHFAKYCMTQQRSMQRNSRERSRNAVFSKHQPNKNQTRKPHGNNSKSKDRRSSRFHSVNKVEDDFAALSFSCIEINNINKEREVTLELKIRRIPQQQDTLTVKMDTGAQGNILPLRIYQKMYPGKIDTRGKPKNGVLQNSKATLTAYGGSIIQQYGTFELECQHNGISIMTTFHVTAPDGPAILGLPSMQKLKLVTFHFSINKEWETPIDQQKTLIQNKSQLLDQYPEIFNGIGKFEGQYHITVNPNFAPVIHPPRRVAILLKDEIKQELDRMVTENIISPVREGEPTAWVNSLVYKRKPSGSLRICLDPKDLNEAICRDHHVIPTLTEILPKLSGAKYFSIVDAKCGYWNVELDKESSYLTTFNSPHGRYRFLRMPFGLKMSQDVFQSKIDQTFEGCPGVIGIADDIVIYGRTEEEHSYNLHKMMQRCVSTGLKLNPDKCQIQQPRIKFYGVICSENGVQPDPTKVSSLKNMKAPTNTKEVQTFLGLATYIGTFISNLSDLTAPLREFTRKNTVFQWTASHQQAFEQIKNAISEETTLTYFNPSQPVILQVDASLKGLGATLLQENRPVAFASKALTDTETRYANIERELLAVVFGCEKFHTYLYGQTFVVETDHKPLESIHLKHLVAAPPRLQRMLLRLQPYDINIVYKPGREIPIADALSRLSPTDEGPIADMDVQIHNIVPNFNNDMLSRIKAETSKDQELIVLKETIYNGWPQLIKQVPQSIRPYWTYRDELSIEEGVLLKGHRIIIPRSLQATILNKLHEAHQGIEKTKLRARTSVFWRTINNDILNITKECATCQQFQPQQTKEPLIPSDIPPRAWHTIGTELFHLNGNDYLLIADYYSKFPFVRKLPSGNSSSNIVVELTKQIFSEHGIPKIVRSDNGPQYDGKPYRDFTANYGFQHITSSPLYPRSNGFIESQVKIVKRTLQKSFETKTDPNIALLCLRSTPLNNKIPAPAELLYNRQIQDNLPRKNFQENNDEIRSALQERQSTQKYHHDQHSKELSPLVSGQKRSHYVNKISPQSYGSQQLSSLMSQEFPVHISSQLHLANHCAVIGHN